MKFVSHLVIFFRLNKYFYMFLTCVCRLCVHHLYAVEGSTLLLVQQCVVVGQLDQLV